MPNAGGGARAAGRALGVLGGVAVVGRTGNREGNIASFAKAYSHIPGAEEIAHLAGTGDKHAMGIVEASLKRGNRVQGFGGYGRYAGKGMPDIFVSGGMLSRYTKWVEVKSIGSRLADTDQLDAFRGFGRGEIVFYGGTRVRPDAVRRMNSRGLSPWFV